MNKNITSKGPWEVSRTFNRATEQNAVVVLGNGGLVVAYFGFLSRKENTDTDRLRLSNAKLASKAPEMLDLLERINKGIHSMEYSQLESLQPEIEDLILAARK